MTLSRGTDVLTLSAVCLLSVSSSLYNSWSIHKTRGVFKVCFRCSCGPWEQSFVGVLGTGAAGGGWLCKVVLLKEQAASEGICTSRLETGIIHV